MADVNQCYLFLQFLARKNQTTSISPNEFQFAFNTGQRQYMDFLIGNVEQFQYGNSTPRVGLGMSSKISRELAPFKVDGVNINVVSQVAPYPTDFQFLAVMKDTQGRKIERIDDAKLPSRLTSVIDNATDNTKSFYVESSTGWTIYPNTVPSIVVNYYKSAPDVVWGFTTVGGRAVYDVNSSVQPLWDSNSLDDILGRAARILGISFSSQTLSAYGDSVINRGE
jgi:hypothetical protein